MDSAGGGGGGGAPWRRQGSISGGGGTNPSALAPPMSVPPAAAGVGASPPPPPPMTPAGAIPPTRLSTEIGPRESKGPPMALASAMMKDKKPFTYTPGKIDLSEIRNPRMARRILMNSQAEGVTSVPCSPSPSTPPAYLPPAALAAMNSAMAIPVLPQGAFNFRNKSVPKEKPEFMRSPSESKERQQLSNMQQQVKTAQQQQQQQQQQQRVHRGQSPSASTSTSAYYNTLSSANASDVNSRQSASFAYPGNTYMQSQQQLSSGNIGTDTSRLSPSPLTPELQPRATTGLGLRPTQTKASSPAPGQNLGSIYIPPNEHQMRQGIFSDRPATSASPSIFENHATCSPMSESLTSNAALPTPLNKAPTPWMNSYNRIQPLQPQQQPPSQSPIPTNNNVGGQNVNVTPWGTGLSNSSCRETGETEGLNILAQSSSPASGAASQIRSSPTVFNTTHSPTPFLPTSTSTIEGFSKQGANVGVQRLPREDSFYNYVPSQSKSFKVIQQITGDGDEGTTSSFSPIDRSLGGRSPTPKAFRQSYPPNLPSSPGPGAQDYSSSYPYQTGSGRGGNTQNMMAGQPQEVRRSPFPERYGNSGQQSSDAEQDYIHNLKLLRSPLNDEPSDTNGSAEEADQSNRMRLKKKLASRPPRPPCRSLSSTPTPTSSTVNGSSSNPKASFVRSRTVSPSPTPRPANCTCSCNCTNNYNNNNGNSNNYYNNHNQSNAGSGSETEDYNTAVPTPRSYSPWPENFDPYDPYAYMQWYYWWYYNYGYPMGWNGYDYSNSRSATPNPNSATETSNNYKSDSEQSEKNYNSQSDDAEETLQSVARNISNYKFGTEESRDDRQGSVPRIIVNRSPDPSSPANASAQKAHLREEVIKQNGGTNHFVQNDSKHVSNSQKYDAATRELKSNENSRVGRDIRDKAEMDARQRLLQEIRSREESISDFTNSTAGLNNSRTDAKHNGNTKMETKFNEFSRLDAKSHENSRLDSSANEKTTFSRHNSINEKSTVNYKTDDKTVNHTANEKSAFNHLANEKSLINGTMNEKIAYSQMTNGNSKYERVDSKSRSEQNFGAISKQELEPNQKSHFDVKSNENGRFEVTLNENGRFDLKTNENTRFDSESTSNSKLMAKINDHPKNEPKSEKWSTYSSNTPDSLNLTPSVCDTETTQKSAKLGMSNEESDSERTQKSDVLYCSSTPEPGQRVIRNSHTRETVLPTTPSSSSFSSSSSELFSEREDNYFDCHESRGFIEESDDDIFKPYTMSGLSRGEVVEVDTNTKSGRSNVGFIDEPEVDISEEDAPTLVDEAAFSPGVTIEECYSSEEATPELKDQFAYPTRPPTRLSTIDEISERSRTTFPTLDEEDALNFDEFQDTVEDLSEPSEDEDSNDENSSVSVIENKSDGHIDWGATTGGESHADEASTSSSDAEDENDDDPLLPTVTVQLPLKLSFSKSMSFRDVPSVLVGSTKQDLDSRPKEPKEKFTYQSGTHDIEELSQSEDYSCEDAAGVIDENQTESEFSVVENCVVESEIDDEPVVSFTISLSRSTSKSCGKKYEDDSECGDELEVDQPEEYPEVSEVSIENNREEEVDFWGEIQKSDESSSSSHRDNDFWIVLKPEVKDSVEEIPETVTNVNAEESNFWDRGRTFGTKTFNRQFSWNLHDDLEEGTPIISEKPVEMKPEPETSSMRTETKDSREGYQEASETEKTEIKSERVSTESKLERTSSETKTERCSSETKSERSTSESAKSERTTREKSEKNVIESRSLKSEDRETKHEETTKTSSEMTKIKTRESSTETKVTENQTKFKNSVQTTTEEVRMRNKEMLSTVKMDTIFSNRKLDDCDFNRNTTNGVTNDNIKPYRHSIGKIPSKDENSDESTDCETKQAEKYELKRTTSLTKKEVNERNVEIKETRENFRVRPNSLNFELSNQKSTPDIKKEEDSKIESTDLQKMTRAEDLLWRIERFLQESLSLGSEDDSGVMTDISRQISDVDTDNDVETEVVIRNKPDSLVNRAARALKTQSLIETTSEIKAYEKVDTSKVVLRNFSAEKKSLRYQRAKTHSRLFQLLQDECHKDEDEEHDIILEEIIDFENLEQVEAAIEKKNEQETKKYNSRNPKERFAGLPDKRSTSNASVDSTSSSSGVLSPSSPVNRDQLLVDIINGLASTKKKGANFPSKIFKLLQQKFGEEFYDTFECCEDDFEVPSTPSTEPQPSFFESRLKQRAQEAIEDDPESPNKSSSWKKDDLPCSNKNEFLQVPQRRKKSILNRDPRVPKTKATPKV